MTDFLTRLIPWYDPVAQAQRERRTTEARNRAILVRIRAEEVDSRVIAVQQSYEQADSRLGQQRRRR